MRTLVALVALVAAAGLAGLGAIYLGLPDVAATTPHWKITEWMLSTAMERGVLRRAAGIAVPGDLDDPERIRRGAREYDEMCAGCHAAPGEEAGEVAEGLMPEPPPLREHAGDWSPAELYWITDHGIRMTGMPAFGPTHSQPRLWDVVAFLRRLPDLQPSEYRALAEGPGASGDEHHEHHEHHDHPHHEG